MALFRCGSGNNNLTITTKTISSGLVWDSGTVTVSGNVGAGYKCVYISNFSYSPRLSHNSYTTIRCDFVSYNSSTGAVSVNVYHPDAMNSCNVTLACIK